MHRHCQKEKKKTKSVVAVYRVRMNVIARSNWIASNINCVAYLKSNADIDWPRRSRANDYFPDWLTLTLSSHTHREINFDRVTQSKGLVSSSTVIHSFIDSMCKHWIINSMKTRHAAISTDQLPDMCVCGQAVDDKQTLFSRMVYPSSFSYSSSPPAVTAFKRELLMVMIVVCLSI